MLDDRYRRVAFLRTACLLAATALGAGVLRVAPLLTPAASAEVATDGTLGRKTRLRDKHVEIGAELGQIRGQNLFHSFERFNVETQGSATFTGPGGLKNVIGRVTGGERSSIDGTLRSTVEGADLWLLNPAGILFGPNARLDVKGSFHASTADELRFSDGAVFSALDANGSQLSVAAPEAFGFLGQNIGRVDVVLSNLATTNGATLSITGGEVAVIAAGLESLSGGLDAGGIILAAQRGAGEVSVDPNARAVARDGSLMIAAGEIDGTVIPGTAVSGGPGGGRIRIEGGEVVIDGALVGTANSGAAIDTGGVDVAARTFALQGRVVNGDPFGGISTATFADGQAGPIRITAADVSVSAAGVDSGGSGQGGGAGPITITADRLTMVNGLIGTPILERFGASAATVVEVRESLVLSAGSGILTFSLNDQPAGPITIRSEGAVTLEGGSVILAQAEGAGAGGDIGIDARTLAVDDSLISSSTSASGDAGSVTITTGQSTFMNGGRARTATSGSGAGGDISVATDVLTVDGGNRLDITTGLVAVTDAGSSGAAGSIGVTAHRAVEVRNGGAIQGTVAGTGDGGTIEVKTPDLDVTGESAIAANTSSDGNAGMINLRVGAPGMGGELTIGSGSFVSNGTSGEGNAGKIDVEAGRLLLEGGRNISSSTSGPGRAGEVTVSAGDVDLRDGSGITSEATGEGDAGTVTVTADNKLVIDGGPSGEVTRVSSSTFSTGAAGRVTVTAGELEVRDGGSISSLTSGEGSGGTVSVEVEQRLVLDGRESPVSITSAALSTGAAGAVTVTANDLQIRNGTIDSDTFGAGDAGSVMVVADGGLAISDGGIISSITTGSGQAGKVTVTAGDLAVRDDGSITSATAGGGNAGSVIVMAGDLEIQDGAIDSSSAGTGNAGTVTVTADRLSIGGGSGFAGIATRTTEESTGNAGTVTVTAKEELTLRDGGRISSTAEGTKGRAGDIVVFAGTLFANESIIETEGTGAEGGRIKVVGTDLINLVDSQVTSNGIEPVADASLITLEAPFIVLNDSRVTSLTGDGQPLTGSGEANLLGDITVISTDSVVAASSSIVTTGVQTDIGTGLQVAPGTFLDVGRLLRESCAARGSRARGTFTRSGKGGLPAAPDRPLASAVGATSEAHIVKARETTLQDVCG